MAKRNDNEQSEEEIKKFIDDVTAIKSEGEDVVQKSIGTLGRWHLFIVLAIFLVKFPIAWHQLCIVFEAAPTDFRCADNGTDKCDPNCTKHEFDRSVFTETIITQWDLVCQRAPLASFTQTITMLGILCGNFVFGVFSDKFGRRGPLVWAVIVQVITGTLSAFVPWFWVFLVLRFLVATATGGTMITSFVLVMELIGAKKRTAVGVLYQIPFNLGHLMLPLFGYFIRDWRYFQIAISLPSIILISYYWIMPESPRWLLAVGRTEEAVTILEKVAKHNNKPTASIRSDVVGQMEKKEKEKNEDAKQGGNILDLFATPNLRKKTICISFNWIVCGLCFFGVAQYVGHLAGNIFVNVAFTASVQLPGTLASMWLMKTLGRKYTIIAGNTLSGVACLLIAVVPAHPAWPRTILGAFGILGLSVSFPTAYIYAGELFPTVIRNIGVGTASMCARIGSMLAPFVAGLTTVQPWLPPVIFGVTPLVGSVLALYLPETLDCKLPDTIEEAELFGKKVEGVNGKVNEESEMNHL